MDLNKRNTRFQFVTDIMGRKYCQLLTIKANGDDCGNDDDDDDDDGTNDRNTNKDQKRIVFVHLHRNVTQ